MGEWGEGQGQRASSRGQEVNCRALPPGPFIIPLTQTDYTAHASSHPPQPTPCLSPLFSSASRSSRSNFAKLAPRRLPSACSLFPSPPPCCRPLLCCSAASVAPSLRVLIKSAPFDPSMMCGLLFSSVQTPFFFFIISSFQSSPPCHFSSCHFVLCRRGHLNPRRSLNLLMSYVRLLRTLPSLAPSYFPFHFRTHISP